MIAIFGWSSLFFFFFNDTATTEIYTLSLHDALPICDARRRAVTVQHLGHVPAEVLEDCERPAVGDRRAVQRVRSLELLLARAEANARAARLVISRIGARRDLAIPLLRREPRLDVVALGRCRREVARRAVDDAVGQPDLLDERLLEREHPLVLVPRLLGTNVDDHLPLLELVHAEHAPRIAAGRPRLAAEAR